MIEGLLLDVVGIICSSLLPVEHWLVVLWGYVYGSCKVKFNCLFAFGFG